MNRAINEEYFHEMCERHEISQQFALYLRELVHYKVVIIADDSGSMQEMTNYRESRWDELKRFMTIVFAVTKCVINNPLDICFMNRPSLIRIQELQEIEQTFQVLPKGGTPTVRLLREVLKQSYDRESYRGRIILICTDGEPNDDRSNSDIRTLKHVLQNERGPNDFVTFLACTDDDDAIGYLNEWDHQIPRVDVCDDYQSEKKEVMAAQGPNFRFSYADYVVKVVLGSVIPELDRLDEKVRPFGHSNNQTRKDPDGCGGGGCKQQ